MSVTAGIYTLGCKVNQYESEAIAEGLAAEGFTLRSPDEACTLYVINTCTVTAESDRKARQFIRRALGHNPEAFVLVTGCLAQVDAAQIAAIPGVDYICGNRNKMSVIPAARDLLARGQKNPAPILNVPTLEGAPFEPMHITRFDRTRAYVKIEDGCESRCAYCIIPRARGKIRSKAPAEVMAEVRALAEGGCREVVLTGIETSAYGRDLGDYGLAELLRDLDRESGIGRIRLGSLDPSLIRPDFVEKIADLPTLAPHFHLSLQSGADHVLRLMRRRYSTEMACAAIERLRAAFPRLGLTADVIVGFPGETEEDFAETTDFLRRARFLDTHIFAYSRRPGTEAAEMEGQIDEAVKRRRSAALIDAQEGLHTALLEEAVTAAEPVPVLFETRHGDRFRGHTPAFYEVEVSSPDVDLRGTEQIVIPTGHDGERLSGLLSRCPTR